MVKLLNMTHLLAIGTNLEKVPLNAFVAGSEEADRLSILEEAQSLSDGFCVGGFSEAFADHFSEGDTHNNKLHRLYEEDDD